MKGKKLATTPIKVATHMAFYHWVAQWVGGKRVLDAGCGEGFGTAHLADFAKFVVGIDKDFSWIRRANDLFFAQNLSYSCMDCQQLSFESDSFDVVISNALLEYLTDVPTFLAEAWRILRPNGVFICGTKNFELSLKTLDSRPLYRNHLQEYTPSELQRLISQNFVKVDLYGQKMRARSKAYINDGKALKIEGALVGLGVKRHIPRNWRSRIRQMITGIDVVNINAEDFVIVKEDMENSYYIIGYGHK